MKKFINKIILALLTVFTIVSCNSDPDNAIYKVLDEKEHGAIIRTLEITSPTFDVVNLLSTFEVIVEEQDEEYGDLMTNIEVYISSASAPEALVKTIPASEFTTSANGLPETTISIVLQDALTALGLSADDVACGDTMGIRLAVNLTDGRTFSAADGSGSLQGSYFSSPYLYNVGIVANLPSDTVYTGQYLLETVTNGLYGVADYVDGVYTVVATGGASRVVLDVPTLAAFGGFGPEDIQLDFVCGEIVLSGSMGAGCNEVIRSGAADVNSTYDLNAPDDSSFIITFTSDVTDDCGQKTQASIRLTKM